MDSAISLATSAGLLVSCWVVVFWLAVAIKRPLAGLLLAYCLHQIMNYVLAAMLPALSGDSSVAVDLFLSVGFAKVLVANLSFALGFAIGIALLSHKSQQITKVELNLKKDINWLLKIGIMANLILVPILNQIPSIGQVAQYIASIVVVAIGLACYAALAANKLPQAVLLLGLSGLLFPLISVIQGGFIGFGANSVIIVLGFFVMRFRPRLLVMPILMVIGYIGLSVFIAYLSVRNEIRASVWGGADYSDRVKTLAGAAEIFEWFDPHSEEQILLINTRLNQNFLVGAAVERLDTGAVDFARGKTVLEALTALVPRILWPDKPVKAGGGNIVSEYTGITFLGETSVGIGPVMEFYVNYGQSGLLVGGLIMGIMLGCCDARAGAFLSQGNGWGATRWYMLGIPLLNPLASLAEISMAYGITMVTIIAIEQGLFRTGWYRRQVQRQAATTPQPVGLVA